MRKDSITFANLGCFLNEGQIIFTKVARAADAQAGSGPTQHDLIRAGLASRFDARQSVPLVELENLLDVAFIIDVVVEHHVVAAIALEEPPILRNSDRYRIYTDFADPIPVVEGLFPMPVFVF